MLRYILYKVVTYALSNNNSTGKRAIRLLIAQATDFFQQIRKGVFEPSEVSEKVKPQNIQIVSALSSVATQQMIKKKLAYAHLLLLKLP